MGKVILEVDNLKTKYITRFGEDIYAVDDEYRIRSSI